MAVFMQERGVLLKDFAGFVKGPAERLKNFAREYSQTRNRPYEYIYERGFRKEERAREIARRDGIEEGLVCVFSAVEGCLSFRLVSGRNRPRLKNSRRKCLCFYFYWIDPQLGLLHVRLQSWFPFTIQICVNGHEWLKRKLQQEGIGYTCVENCFTHIEDLSRAESLSREFADLSLVEMLSGLAHRFNPLFDELLQGMTYYWVCDQAEYSTDILFKDPEALKPLYEKFLEHAIIRFGAKDILTFLDKCSDGRFRGRQFNHCRRRQMGARVRHWVKCNWIKMYNKAGTVVRVETVINYPYDFLIYRHGIRKGERVRAWFPMSKSVVNLYRYAQISRTANNRYLSALASQDDPRPAEKELRELAEPVDHGRRRLGGFNPALETDRLLFGEIMRAEYLVRGFQNRDIRHALFGCGNSLPEKRRYCSRVTRLLQKLHRRRLIAKIPRSRRWRITQKGSRILGALLAFFHQEYPRLSAQPA